MTLASISGSKICGYRSPCLLHNNVRIKDRIVCDWGSRSNRNVYLKYYNIELIERMFIPIKYYYIV